MGSAIRSHGDSTMGGANLHIGIIIGNTDSQLVPDPAGDKDTKIADKSWGEDMASQKQAESGDGFRFQNSQISKAFLRDRIGKWALKL